jgi:hypothetical protein
MEQKNFKHVVHSGQLVRTREVNLRETETVGHGQELRMSISARNNSRHRFNGGVPTTRALYL